MAGWATGHQTFTVGHGTQRRSRIADRVPNTREVRDIHMRLNRTLLYTGVFVAAVGIAMLAADAGQLDAAALIQALGLWPVAIIAVGVGIVLLRTPVSLAGGLLAVAVPGLVLGGMFALGPRLAAERGYLHALEAAYGRYHIDCADLGARLDFGTVEIDPIGGCP